MWPQKEHSKCRVLLAEQTTWSDVLWFVTLCVFKLELQGFYPCCDVWIGSWIGFFVCVCENTTFKSLRGRGTNFHSLTPFLFLCDKLYMNNSQWMLPSARPDQTFLCRKKEQKHHSQVKRENTTLWERNRQRDRQRVKKRTEWEQSCRVGWTLLWLNSITVY